MLDSRALRYLGASLAALAADMGTFLLLLRWGAGAPGWAGPASALAYAVGIAVHWLASSRAVFADSLAARGRARHRQKALFVASAVVGLAITTLTVAGLARAGVDARAAKLAAIVLSFAVTWALRNRIVFAAPGRA